MNSNIIEVRDMCFAYGEQEVLHNVSFSVAKHSFTAVVGPNGGGKTTLLKLLLGELQPMFGSILISGAPPRYSRGKIGYVPQSFPFDPRFPVSVMEVVLMGRVGGGIFGFHGAEDFRRVDEALAAVGLAGFGARSFAGLSGGERQRVLIAQALAGGCELLFLDEPTANVDPMHAVELYKLFSSLKSRLTIMMVSHNLSVVTSSATHVLCVNRSADMHTIGELSAGSVGAANNSMALLNHDHACHILDVAANWNSPHAAFSHKKTEEKK